MSITHISQAVSAVVTHRLHMDSARVHLANRHLPEAFVALVEATEADLYAETGDVVRIPTNPAFRQLFHPRGPIPVVELVPADDMVDCPACGGMGVFDVPITSVNSGTGESVSRTSYDVECGVCDGACQVPADQVGA